MSFSSVTSGKRKRSEAEGVFSRQLQEPTDFPLELTDEDAYEIVDAVSMSDSGAKLLHLAMKELKLRDGERIPPEHVSQVIGAAMFDHSMYGKARNAQFVLPTKGSDPPNLQSLFDANLLDPCISSFSLVPAYSKHLSQPFW
eukprot:2715849-Rhodomonas_salina.3